MKVGETVPVYIAGQVVAHAKVRELNLTGDQPSATLVVPGTVVVMGVRTQIDTPQPVEPEKETVITGVERTSAPVGGESNSNEGTSTTSEAAQGSGESTVESDSTPTTEQPVVPEQPVQEVAPTVQEVTTQVQETSTPEAGNG